MKHEVWILTPNGEKLIEIFSSFEKACELAGIKHNALSEEDKDYINYVVRSKPDEKKEAPSQEKSN